MISYLQKLALISVISLVCLTLNTMASPAPSCSDSGKVVAPGDTISVVGPTNTQQSLGISWQYQWTLTKAGNPSPIDQVTKTNDATYSYVVPSTETATTYSLNLMVTATQATTCINMNCVLITVSIPAACTITPPDTNTFCTGTSQTYTYSTGITPGYVLQRWWLLPDPVTPSSITYSTSGSRSDVNTLSIDYNGVTPGKYWIFSGYYPKKGGTSAPLGYCMTPVIVVAVPGNSIQISP
jgi:hypothetical protein